MKFVDQRGLVGCAFRGRGCTGTVERYVVKPRTAKVARELGLCTFHGQAWPKVGEDPKLARTRTAKARRALEGRLNFYEQSKRRSSEARKRANDARAAKKRQAEDVELPAVDTSAPTA